MTRTSKLAVWALSVAAVPIVSVGLLLTADPRWLEYSQRGAVEHGRFVALMLLTEAALLVVCAPPAGLLTAMRISASGAEWLDRRPAMRVIVGAWRLARRLVTRITLLSATSAAIVLAMGTAIDANTVLQSHAMLWATALMLATFGAACGSMFSEPLDGAACALAIALAAATGVFAAGPSVDAIPRWLLDAALLFNPLVATAASANIDLFRMELLYQLSPLAHRDVGYPAPVTAFATYSCVALGLLLLTARQFNRAAVFSVERMSA